MARMFFAAIRAGRSALKRGLCAALPPWSALKPCFQIPHSGASPDSTGDCRLGQDAIPSKSALAG